MVGLPGSTVVFLKTTIQCGSCGKRDLGHTVPNVELIIYSDIL